MVTVTDIDDDWKQRTLTIEHQDPQYVADELADWVRRGITDEPKKAPSGQQGLFEETP